MKIILKCAILAAKFLFLKLAIQETTLPKVPYLVIMANSLTKLLRDLCEKYLWAQES